MKALKSHLVATPSQTMRGFQPGGKAIELFYQRIKFATASSNRLIDTQATGGHSENHIAKEDRRGLRFGVYPRARLYGHLVEDRADGVLRHLFEQIAPSRWQRKYFGEFARNRL